MWIRPFDTLSLADLAVAGGKGANLGELVAAGLPVPPGFVVTTGAYDTFVERAGIGEELVAAARAVRSGSTDMSLRAAEQASELIRSLFAVHPVPDDIAAEITQAYVSLDAHLAGQLPVAVRSSATAEDLPGASFAGQQDTFLNVSGAPAVVEAVRQCWASLWSPRAILYRLRAGIDPATVSLAVVVQELVDADASGVMFTVNPANGRRDEIVVAAAWGLGESVVGGSVTPDDLVIRRTDDGLVVASNHVSAKEHRTILTPIGTQEVEVPPGLQRLAVLQEWEVLRLAELGEQIEKHYGTPMDVEWARGGGELAIVQARPVTALPEPVGEVPTSWDVPDPTAMYARASIVEQLPDPLTPLFADLIGPAVTDSLSKLFGSVRASVAKPGDISFAVLNGYAYYCYTRPALLRLSAAAMPMLLGGKLSHPEKRWAQEYRPAYQHLVAEQSARDLAALDLADLFDAVVELLGAGCEYYTCVQMIIPVAATTETAFTKLYESSLRRPGDPPATTFLLGADSEPIRAERALFDLAQWCRDQPGLSEGLNTARVSAASLVFGPAPDGVADQVWRQWQRRIGDHLGRFGHAVYNLDFANPVAADAPEPVLVALRYYLEGALADPVKRADRLRAERDAATHALMARLDPVRRRAVGALLRRAQAIAPIREDALADVGLAWPQLRRLLRELGGRLVDTGLIDEPDDVFWLTRQEIQTAINYCVKPDTAFDSVREYVADRKATWRGRKLVSPPQILPDNRLNHAMERWMPSRSDNDSGDVLRGLGASGGQVTAEACVVLGADDFARLRPGQVLVAPITTPAFTPLFALAGGVVTDIGGPLSHSSIVAREYGIPAVLGTGVASRRIRDGQRITVDGTAGTVELLDPHPLLEEQ